jgi:hypothetical protein
VRRGRAKPNTRRLRTPLIRQRVYRGDVDCPKWVRAVRFAVLSGGLPISIDARRAVSLDTSANFMGFPSEKLATPLAKDKLEAVFSDQARSDRFGLGKRPVELNRFAVDVFDRS